ncbi:MAG: hypothetical protein ACR2GF_06410 [Acidimicrobiales bacterium]
MNRPFWEPLAGAEPILDLPRPEVFAAPPRNILEFPEALHRSDKGGPKPRVGGVAQVAESPVARAEEIQGDAGRGARELVIEARREAAELRAAAAKDREDARALLINAEVHAAKLREEATTGAGVQAATVRVEAEEGAKARRHGEALRAATRVAEEKFEAAIALARQRLG